MDGPREDVADITRYAYDADNNLVQVTNALNHTTALSDHDAAGRPQRLIDPNGVVTELRYDTHGRLTHRTVDSATTTLTYDAVGNLAMLRLPTGATLTYHFDAARRLTGIEDAHGNRIDYTLDAAGNQVEERIHDQSGQLRYQHARVFDELSRLREAIGARGQTSRTTYDANGNPTKTIDPNGNPSASAFDALNRLVETVDAGGGRTTYGYNAIGRITEVADPRGNVTRYAYNGFGERIRRESPDTGEGTFAHDAAGNRIRAIDARGKVAKWSYDALNRPTAVHYPDDPARGVTLHYDAPEAAYGIGRLTAMGDASGTTRYQYTSRGLLQEETHETDDGVEATMRYGYDAADQLSRLTYQGGAIVHYGRDAAGRVSRVKLEHGGVHQVLADYLRYAPFGPLTALSYGNGLTFSRSFDQDYQLKQLTSGPVERDYARDPAGNITTITDYNDYAHRQTFGYDPLHRLTDAEGGYGERGYDYDALGNRETRHDNGQQTDYTIEATSNRLLAIEAEDLEYDVAGNLVRQGARTFAYDGAGRLQEVRRDGTLIATYTYNARGQRTRKQVRLHGSVQDQGRRPAGRGRPAHAGPPDHAGRWVTTHFVYDQAGQLLAEMDERGAVQRAYIWLDAQPLALLTHTGRRGRVAYYHTDHLGTPQALTDARGNVVWAAAYRPFGAADVETARVTNNLRFPGQYYDAETGLHYNLHRYYDPETGRYLTSDPVGLEGGLNTYVYVAGNPIRNVDPLGLATYTVGISGSFQHTAAGGSASLGFGFDSSRQVCIQFSTCGRIGPGESASATVGLSVGEGLFCEGNSASGGVFAEGGSGWFGGGSADYGTGGASGTGAINIGIGAGGAAGAQACMTRTKCF